MRKVKYKEMGNRIRQARIKLGLKQKDCIEKLGDITPQMLSDWENGYVCPSINYLINIANYFKVSLDYIVLGIEDKKETSIRTYKDAIEMMIALENSGLFECSLNYAGINCLYSIDLQTFDKTIIDFKRKYDDLEKTNAFMKKDIFKAALDDLKESYNKDIVKKESVKKQ